MKKHHPYLLAITTLCSLLLAACSHTPPAPEPEPEPQSTASVTPAADSSSAAGAIIVRKSPNDNREYRYLVLDNGLRTLLVKDPDTDKAAASLTVMRGSYHEPDEYPGLAHFLEHMLFIGTAKYPEVDGYQQFIAAHGGSSNAYTASDHTNYFFDIQPQHFADGMDRFSQFFISPLLDPAYVEREKNAVNSEYQLQIKDDGWRGMSATKAAMNPAYPGARFNIGSLETLGDGVADALIEFFETEYSADQMVLVALSNEPLNEIEAWVRPMFGAIENHNAGAAPNQVKAFTDTQLPAVLTYRSLKDEYRLSFNFPIPATEPYYRKKPVQYLTNLLGHEGVGSLYGQLKEQGWIQTLGAGASRLDNANAYVSIDIELTDAGRGAIEEITDALFGYIELLNRTAPERWRYQEQALVAELGFRYQEKSSATAFVYQAAPALALYPPQDILVAPYLMDEFDAALIKDYLGYLTRDNLIATISGPDVETNATETWFGVPYRLEARRVSDGNPDGAGLALPERNPFLPEDLDLLAGSDGPPSLAINEPGLRIWLAVDTEFGVPRANQYFTLALEGGHQSPNDVALAHLYARLVKDSLNEYTYPALLAGLGYQLTFAPAGFQLGLSGYADKQTELMDTVLERFTTLEIDADRFAVNRSELMRDWRNFRSERPYTQTYGALTNLLISTSWSPDDLADALAGVTREDLVRWRQARFEQFAVVGLSHGNIDRKRLDRQTRSLKRRLNIVDMPVSKPQIVDIENAYLLEVPIDHNDASMALYVQDGDASFQQRARSALATQILRQQYFSSLRTEQQLGYVVAVTNRTLRDRGGLTFVIQSPVASPRELEAATITFMEGQLPALDAMSDDAFAQQKIGLISRLTERDKNLRERTGRYLADLDVDVTSFDSSQQIATIVGGLEKADMRDFLQTVMSRLRERRVMVYNVGRFSDAPSVGIRLAGTGAFKTPEQTDQPATSSR